MSEALAVTHLTSVHSRCDTRIFLKQCSSLAAAGYDVTLVVADGLGDDKRQNVQIVDIGRPAGRLGRMIGSTRRILKKAIEIDADLYHFHDPELLPAGYALKRRGKKVIYDAHEDVPGDILSKAYIPSLLRWPVAACAGLYERSTALNLDHVVTATSAIRDRLTRLGISATAICNFPLRDELHASAPTTKGREVCYVGGLATARGIRELVQAMELSSSRARLNLAGSFAEARLESDVKAMPGWKNVNELGFLSRLQIRETLGNSVAGVVTLRPTHAYLNSLPIKMFEYMSAGLPVIASDFPLWREIIEGNDCGICVDPLDPRAIAAAIDRLIENPDMARQMGKNGRRAVEERYNWAVEEKKLLALYEKLLRKT